jgi:hypothetical protein
MKINCISRSGLPENMTMASCSNILRNTNDSNSQWTIEDYLIKNNKKPKNETPSNQPDVDKRQYGTNIIRIARPDCV